MHRVIQYVCLQRAIVARHALLIGHSRLQSVPPYVPHTPKLCYFSCSFSVSVLVVDIRNVNSLKITLLLLLGPTNLLHCFSTNAVTYY